MRTTISLDEDVRAELDAQRRKTGTSFKEAVNEALRIGLEAQRKVPPNKPYTVTPHDFGPPPGWTFDNIEELLDELEGPMRR